MLVAHGIALGSRTGEHTCFANHNLPAQITYIACPTTLFDWVSNALASWQVQQYLQYSMIRVARWLGWQSAAKELTQKGCAGGER